MCRNLVVGAKVLDARCRPTMSGDGSVVEGGQSCRNLVVGAKVLDARSRPTMSDDGSVVEGGRSCRNLVVEAEVHDVAESWCSSSPPCPSCWAWRFLVQRRFLSVRYDGGAGKMKPAPWFAPWGRLRLVTRIPRCGGVARQCRHVHHGRPSPWAPSCLSSRARDEHGRR